MPKHHLAQINIARLIAPIDDPRIAGFVSQLDIVNRVADASAGFVWRLQGELLYGDDPFIIVNLSVWESIEALQEFTYRSRHLEVLRDRKKWFDKMDAPHYCLWWVPAGHRPSLAEGRKRLQGYQQNGPTPEAFWFSERYPAPDLVAH